MASGVDHRKIYKELFAPPKDEPVLVEVPELGFLTMEGKGYPGESQEWADAMQALYSLSYAVRFALKDEGFVYKVMPAEALWWADDMEAYTQADRKSEWVWKAMIFQPEEVTGAHLDAAMKKAAKKVDSDVLGRVLFERWAEGQSAQIMHIGPYSEEAPTIEKLHAFIDGQGLKRRGRHHEIYLGDPAKSKPENLKTIIRQPVE